MKPLKEISALKKEFEEFERIVQAVAVSALWHAQNGYIETCNELIYAIGFNSYWNVSSLVFWFESHGKLKWSNKKHRIVNSQSGYWKLDKAENINSLTYEELTPGSIYSPAKEGFALSELYATKAPLSQIQQHLASNPIDASEIGKFGVPADKNCWGKYKIKVKRK
jgi:hypothetical protein